jgi:hypothetical protein
VTTRPGHRDELIVLSLLGGGMIVTVILVIIGIFGWFESKAIVTIDGVQQTAPLPNWAENVLVAVISIFAVKIGDVLNALVTLATGRQVEKMGDRLANSSPTKDVPESVEEAADQVADAAAAEAEGIKGT